MTARPSGASGTGTSQRWSRNFPPVIHSNTVRPRRSVGGAPGNKDSRLHSPMSGSRGAISGLGSLSFMIRPPGRETTRWSRTHRSSGDDRQPLQCQLAELVAADLGVPCQRQLVLVEEQHPARDLVRSDPTPQEGADVALVDGYSVVLAGAPHAEFPHLLLRVAVGHHHRAPWWPL